MENESQEANSSPTLSVGDWIASGVLSCMLAFLVIVLPIYLVLDYLHEQRVDHTASAGVIVAVHPVGSWVPDSLIETTTGFYTVDGSVSLLRGMRFNLETRDNDAQFLCDPGRTFCGRVVGRGLENDQSKQTDNRTALELAPAPR